MRSVTMCDNTKQNTKKPRRRRMSRLVSAAQHNLHTAYTPIFSDFFRFRSARNHQSKSRLAFSLVTFFAVVPHFSRVSSGGTQTTTRRYNSKSVDSTFFAAPATNFTPHTPVCFSRPLSKTKILTILPRGVCSR